MNKSTLPRVSLNKTKWLEEGIQILSESSQEKIRILVLCKRLGVTRGSFYHHFTSIEDYIRSLMEFWKNQNTKKVIENVNQKKDFSEKFQLLNYLTYELNSKVELAIRSWALYDSNVALVLKEVDHVRIQFLIDIYIGLGFKKRIAFARARLDYASFVGIQQLFLDLKKCEFNDIFNVYQNLRENEAINGSSNRD